MSSGSVTSPTERPETSGFTAAGRLEIFCQVIFPPNFLVGAAEYLNAASENFSKELIFLSIFTVRLVSSSVPCFNGTIISVNNT